MRYTYKTASSPNPPTPHLACSIPQHLQVVEVGCGTGIAGLSLALKGADVTLTDLPSVQDRTDDHIALNADNIAASGGSACFKILDWRKIGAWGVLG